MLVLLLDESVLVLSFVLWCCSCGGVLLMLTCVILFVVPFAMQLMQLVVCGATDATCRLRCNIATQLRAPDQQIHAVLFRRGL